MTKFYRFQILTSIFALCYCCCLLGNRSFAQTPKEVLVLFHGVNETTDDLSLLADSVVDTKLFANVVAIKFDWKNKTIPDAAPEIFRNLDKLFGEQKFTLMGTSEGGLLADWIAKKVKASEGRIIRVITVNTPLDGKPDAANETTLARLSSVAGELNKTPANDIDEIEFIRLWEKDNKIIAQSSALPELRRDERNAKRLIVRTKPFDPREVIPGMLAQARKDFAAEDYSKVIEACRYIAQADAGQTEAKSLLGLGLYNSAMREPGLAKASEQFDESLGYLAEAIDSGDEITFSVTHHHNFSLSTGIPVFQGGCLGQITINKDLIVFISSDPNSPNGHNFVAASHKIRNVQFINSQVGTIHLEIDAAKDIKGSFQTKEFNFLPSKVKISTNVVPLTAQGGFGVGKIDCDETCPVIAKTLHTIIERVSKMPRDIAKPSEEVKLKAVHWGLLQKNNHIGDLTISPAGMKWEETENNSNIKDNFKITWADIEAFRLGFRHGHANISGNGFNLDLKNHRGMVFYTFADKKVTSIQTMRLIYLYSGIIPQPAY